MEFIIAGLLLLLSIFILYKNLKSKKNGSCNCCSSKDCANCHKAVLNTIEKK
ncbi:MULTISPECIES: FeoB-associated Cys-rich membrane protein [Clostridium]|uniref:FeoB-associated Cys-rich membrane protein n=1 Tax=Clostridium cadaveris TaxID=1529 RepID=A0A1I2JJP3_9CLOT|nr:FeoB-associated Cys-rich membrane protein [Clostridium cadaveris]MDU4951243.1 FeoB-associated Cys-rich membrane protein [Clostridium sp.]MDM8312294.1 FeoB-associated Cys-rich membrane protein [Clostridium cadaveris]NME63913.1 FeoB-associated Cys-rich membrane protein [Clostridium cadaveris]NWK10520.1 FeoB-associated Cys-rich membrane protein [Clostridium cadaveris]PWL51898.1 MAG: FeoB-associated Cys-rich membrane protein [Clostridium cadaveris]